MINRNHNLPSEKKVLNKTTDAINIRDSSILNKHYFLNTIVTFDYEYYNLIITDRSNQDFTISWYLK